MGLLKMGPIGFPEMYYEITTTHCVINQKIAVLICFIAEAWIHAKSCKVWNIHGK